MVWQQWRERKRERDERGLSHGEKLWRKWQKVWARSGGRWADGRPTAGDKIVYRQEEDYTE